MAIRMTRMTGYPGIVIQAAKPLKKQMTGQSFAPKHLTQKRPLFSGKPKSRKAGNILKT